MKALSIGRIALYFLVLASLLVLGLATYFWEEIGRTTQALHTHENQAARQEMAESLQAVVERMRGVGEDLAQWDETKQQLIFPEYYTLWRDNRVRNVGLLPNSADTVALYDKSGKILLDANSPDPMPTRMTGTAPKAVLFRDQRHDHEHLYYFMPVHADPEGKILLGYLGIKFDLLGELKLTRAYRYADLSSLKLDLPLHGSIGVDQAMEHITVTARPNPELTAFRQLLESTMVRLAVAMLGTLLFAAWLSHRLLVRPLRGLSRDIDALREHDIAIQGPSPKAMSLPVLELENLRNSFNDYQSRLAGLHRDLEKSSKDFHGQARQDALTGVFNRRAFDEDWRHLEHDRRLENVALFLFDCDHFKAINDSYGHNVGDAVIRSIAQCLESALRTNDRLYRIGGDEFCAILTNSEQGHTETIAERCLEHILAHNFRQYGLSEPVTISIGIAVGRGEKLSLNELQKRADLAMYSAKRPGGQKIVFYSAAMGSTEALVANREINAVFQAIQDPGLIEIAYQAVIRLPMMQVEYSEALTRIRFDGALIMPDAIFPIVQDRNLDAEFDLAIIRAINRDIDLGILAPGQGVSINITAPGIVNAKVVDAMVALLEAERGRKIVVEITETALISQMETATSNIERLRTAGALVALDDFGSGYSSLRYLSSMPVDLVKFDISMVRLLENGDRRQKLVIEEIARMVITAGYELVAEGIETRSLLDRVIGLGFSHAQGFYFGRPIRPAGLTTPVPASAEVVEQG